MNNRIRALVLVVAFGMGIVVAVAWKAWKTAKSVPEHEMASSGSRNSGGDGGGEAQGEGIKIFKPATLPTNPEIYSPKRAPVIVKVKVPPDPDKILARSTPSVVRIVAYDAKGEPIAQGSGFIITTGGLVVTNYHVIKGSALLSVAFENKKKVEVEGVAAVDPDGNLALIKIKGALPGPLQLASADPAVDADTFAIGNPLGIKNTVSEGKISHVRKDTALTLIQTTSAVTPGSSGGPLLNEDGKVLGVATLYMKEGQTLNLAIGYDRVQKLLESYKGGVIPPSKQTWVSNNVERDQIAHWLAKAAAEAPKMRADRSRICAGIAEGYARSGDAKGLAKILEFVDSGDSAWQQQATNAGLRARAGDADGARAILGGSSNQRLRMHGHVSIATALRDRGDVVGFGEEIQAAIDIAKSQKDNIVRGDWLIVIARACADAGQFEAAMNVVALLSDSGDPNLNAKANPSGSKRNFKSSALAHVGVGKAKVRDWAGAEALADELFDEFDRAYLLASIAEQRARSGDPAGAFPTAQRVSVGYMKNRAMLEVAEASAKMGDGDRTREAIAEAIGAAGTIKEGWRKSEANLRLISALAFCGDIASAEKLAYEINDMSARSTAMGSIAVAWAKRGDAKKMNAALEQIKDAWAGESAFSEVAVVQARAGQLRGAIRTIERIPSVEVRVQATRAIIKACSGKLPAQVIAENAGRFALPEQKAAAYLGLAEGIMDRGESAAARTPTGE